MYDASRSGGRKISSTTRARKEVQDERRGSGLSLVNYLLPEEDEEEEVNEEANEEEEEEEEEDSNVPFLPIMTPSMAFPPSQRRRTRRRR
ncbi:hypothetical protein QR685DRAFT_575613 [Neurospora intermedia]|uniref:Uncharacterized protein n=1 Tax=Neurospora intermedia TaxID=5142 RepID=A0ABR3D127_NEUIN